MKTIAFVILLLTSFMVSAEWFFVGIDENGISYYIDPNSMMRTQNHVVRAWVLEDYKTKKAIVYNITYKSMAELAEVDCNDKKIRMMSRMMYSKGMSNGDLIYKDDTVDQYAYYPPYTVASLIIDTLCAR